MALSDLSARGDAGQAGLPAAAALRRWAAGLATAATGGLLLLWTARDAAEPDAGRPPLRAPADA